ncbi:hypothetical protein A3Q56_03929, partial [Intoshia linei]
MSERDQCPMMNKEKRHVLCPLNKMEEPNQQPSPDQPFKLSKKRQISTIMKNDKSRWIYPSEQMFWNAMRRKGWKWSKDFIKSQDMTSIVNIHNINNEKAWNDILKWEYLTHFDCKKLQLIKFGGRAKDFTARATIRSYF